MYNIRNVTPEDLQSVTDLEAACFPPLEAAPKDTIAYRISAFPERFFVAESKGEIAGMINGCATDLPYITDELFLPQGHDPKGKNQMVFSLAVHPQWRRQGIGGALMRHLIEFARKNGLSSVVLTCKAEKIAYYESFGFTNCGLSRSVHGGAVWYDLVLKL